jgi:DNA modification methylase
MDQPSCRVIVGDALTELRKLPSGSVHCCVTSPPYWQLRDYGVDGQLGLERTVGEYLAAMVRVFREVRRVLRDDGTLWLNLGDTYVSSWPCSQVKKVRLGSMKRKRTRLIDGLKEKDMAGVPWRVALALQTDGWYLRSDIIWHKPNALPESVKDRPTRAHEYVFLLSKSRRYYYDVDAIREPCGQEGRRKRLPPWSAPRYGARGNSPLDQRTGPAMHPKGRNKRTVWTIPVRGYRGAHTATFPEKLVEPCILASCPIEGTVLDPFAGVGTTLVVASHLNRNSLGIELNPDYSHSAREHVQKQLDDLSRDT